MLNNRSYGERQPEVLWKCGYQIIRMKSVCRICIMFSKLIHSKDSIQFNMFTDGYN